MSEHTTPANQGTRRGRPVELDDAEVGRMLASGYSRRDVAALLGCSASAIQRASRRICVQANPSQHSTYEFVHSRRPTRPLVRYHGGKWLLAPWIIGYMPTHRVYTEVFGGGGSVLLRKERSQVEVYNDADGEIVNLFRVLSLPRLSRHLHTLLERTPYSREMFVRAYAPAADPVERARRTLVKSWMSFGGTGIMPGAIRGPELPATGVPIRTPSATGFRAKSEKNTAAREWGGWLEQIDALTSRLRGVTIEHKDGKGVVVQHDAPDALHYVDPPYPLGARSDHVTRRSGKGYRHEMSDNDHRDLAAALHQVRGMVLLSGYACDLYDRELFPDWTRITRRALADGARERTEVLWLNPAAAAACPIPLNPQQPEASLFDAVSQGTDTQHTPITGK